MIIYGSYKNILQGKIWIRDIYLCKKQSDEYVTDRLDLQDELGKDILSVIKRLLFI